MLKKAMCIALFCAVAPLGFASAVPASAAPVPAPSASPRTTASEVEAVKAEIATLHQQQPRDDAKIELLTRRLAQLEAAPAPTGSTAPRTSIENRGLATKTTLSNDEIQSSNAQSTYDAVKNVPGVWRYSHRKTG